MKNFRTLELAVEYYNQVKNIKIPRHLKEQLLRSASSISLHFSRSHPWRGWKIISAAEAFTDPLYFEEPRNTYANNGIIAPVDFEITGKKAGFWDFENLEVSPNTILKLR
jgi:hypothetical protein